MTLPAYGSLSMSQVNSELALVSTGQLSFSSTLFRTLAGVLSGDISMSSLRGKSNRTSISLTISDRTDTYNAYNSAVATGNYAAGRTDITITVNSGVYIGAGFGSTSMTISGFTAGDTVTLNNNGYIIGYGGPGGAGNGVGAVYVAGFSGGNALSLSFATTINNAGIIAGGGGGGGGGASRYLRPLKGSVYYDGGGGGGGGAGTGISGGPSSSGAAGGAGGTGSTNDLNYTPGYGYSGGYGLFFNLGFAIANYGGIGGGYENGRYSDGSDTGFHGGAGGNGGGLGQNGADGGLNSEGGGDLGTSIVGGSAGYYIIGGSYATWAATGTRYGLAG